MARGRHTKRSQSACRESSTPSLSSKILGTLATIDRPADFCANGQFPSIFPGLQVDGLGDIALPLSAKEAKRLIKLCQQAPYGKGTRTVVDTQVRNVWELAPSHFSLENPKWGEALETVLRQIEGKLGLPQQALAAHLYKLLVYEKGSFFLPHRDGEKLSRMVATLVVNLPTKYHGGELIVAHQGKQQTIVMSGAASGLETEFAAFYADCKHEVRPLQSGYRLCLIYNLTLAKPRSRLRIKTPDFEEATHQLAMILSGWASMDNAQPAENDSSERHDHPSPKRLAVMLAHQYTMCGLSIDDLKGIDLAKANVLFDAAERAQCDAHLALVTYWQYGLAEVDDFDYVHGGWSDSDWDEEGASKSGSMYFIGSVDDCSLTANHLSDRKGKRVSFGDILLRADEIVAAEELTSTPPSREEFEDYTGNAAATLERWYHKAAILIWPRDGQGVTINRSCET